MYIYKALMIILLSTPFFSSAETGEYHNKERTQELMKITSDYVNCLNSAMGNFSSNKVDIEVTNKFYEVIILNIKEMLDIEISSNNKMTLTLLDALKDKKILLGFMVAALTQPSTAYESKRNELELLKYNWRKVNKKLWSLNGCNAIYNSIK